MKETSVLIINLAKRYGGAEVRVLDIAKALHGRCNYTVATLSGSPLHQRLDKAGLNSLPVSFSRGNPWLLVFLFISIRRNEYNVIDAHNVQSQFWGNLAALLAGVRKISTVHSAYRDEYSNSFKGRLYEFVLRLNSWWNVQFVVVSEAVEEYLRNLGLKEENIKLIHNGFYVPNQVNVLRDSIPIFRNLGWNDSHYVVIVVARLEYVKGHIFLIEALEKALKRHTHIRCLIVGEGRTRSVLENQIEEAQLDEKIYLVGFQDDTSIFLSVSDAFC